MKLQLPYRTAVYFSSPYGVRVLNGVQEWHAGIDLVGQEDKTILAPCSGVIGVSAIFDPETDRTRTWEWGNYIRIDTDDGYWVYLCHLHERYVSAGQRVNAGDEIGVEGSTGRSFGSHCHLEVRVGYNAVNPCPFLAIENTAGAVFMGQGRTDKQQKNNGNTPHAWAEDAVRWAAENRILLGSDTETTSYRLGDFVTREEALVFLYRCMKKGEGNVYTK